MSGLLLQPSSESPLNLNLKWKSLDFPVSCIECSVSVNRGGYDEKEKKK